jgi:hypothetical protein
MGAHFAYPHIEWLFSETGSTAAARYSVSYDQRQTHGKSTRELNHRTAFQFMIEGLGDGD